MTEQCKTCGAAICWATTPNGVRMPVDAAPVADGNVLLTQPTASSPLTAVVLPHGREPTEGQLRYTSHFATCPQARQHRRPAARRSAP